MERGELRRVRRELRPPHRERGILWTGGGAPHARAMRGMPRLVVFEAKAGRPALSSRAPRWRMCGAPRTASFGPGVVAGLRPPRWPARWSARRRRSCFAAPAWLGSSARCRCRKARPGLGVEAADHGVEFAADAGVGDRRRAMARRRSEGYGECEERRAFACVLTARTQRRRTPGRGRPTEGPGSAARRGRPRRAAARGPLSLSRALAGVALRGPPPRKGGGASWVRPDALALEHRADAPVSRSGGARGRSWASASACGSRGTRGGRPGTCRELVVPHRPSRPPPAVLTASSARSRAGSFGTASSSVWSARRRFGPAFSSSRRLGRRASLAVALGAMADHGSPRMPPRSAFPSCSMDLRPLRSLS